MTKPITHGTCDYCGMTEGVPCRSAGGFVYTEGAHKARRDLARESGIAVPKHSQSSVDLNAPPSPLKTPQAKLRWAVSFIERMGGVEEARRIFEAAASAIKEIDERQES